MNTLKAFSKYQQFSRNITTTSKTMRDMAKFKELQRQMQVDDGVPVFLKKGASDRVLFSFICVGMFVTFCMAMNTLRRIIVPKPNA
ncbi:hypothetical protein X975_19248, partial [Stegodyphus mimosarum]